MLVIGGTGLAGSNPSIEVLPSAYSSYSSNNLQRTIPSLPSVSEQSFYSAGCHNRNLENFAHNVHNFSLHWAGSDDLHHRLGTAHPLWLDLQARSAMRMENTNCCGDRIMCLGVTNQQLFPSHQSHLNIGNSRHVFCHESFLPLVEALRRKLVVLPETLFNIQSGKISSGRGGLQVNSSLGTCLDSFKIV